MNKKTFKLVFIAVVMLVVFPACLAWGAPKVRMLPAQELAKARRAIAENTDGVPPQWIAGMIVEEWYQKSYGLDSDSYNNVRFRVYIPNGLVVIYPCNGRQEMHLVRDLDPGDLIAYNEAMGLSRNNSRQNQLWLCREDIMMIEKGLLGPPIGDAYEGEIK